MKKGIPVRAWQMLALAGLFLSTMYFHREHVRLFAAKPTRHYGKGSGHSVVRPVKLRDHIPASVRFPALSQVRPVDHIERRPFNVSIISNLSAVLADVVDQIDLTLQRIWASLTRGPVYHKRQPEVPVRKKPKNKRASRRKNAIEDCCDNMHYFIGAQKSRAVQRQLQLKRKRGRKRCAPSRAVRRRQHAPDALAAVRGWFAGLNWEKAGEADKPFTWSGHRVAKPVSAPVPDEVYDEMAVEPYDGNDQKKLLEYKLERTIKGHRVSGKLHDMALQQTINVIDNELVITSHVLRRVGSDITSRAVEHRDNLLASGLPVVRLVYHNLMNYATYHPRLSKGSGSSFYLHAVRGILTTYRTKLVKFFSVKE